MATRERTPRVVSDEGAAQSRTRDAALIHSCCPSYWRQLRALVWKELLVETRSRESLLSAGVFALLVLVVFNFAFDLRVENAASVAPGVLWVTVSFAGVLSLGRAFARERDRQTLDGLLLAPVERSALFAAKALASALAMLVVQVVAVPAFIALFNLRVDLPRLMLALLLGTIGYAGVGTLFAAMAAHTRAREAMLPLLLFPVQVPVILGTVKSLGAALALPGTPAPEDPANWLGLLVAFDGLFLGLSALLFDYALDED
jgi:heme exporter protein B